MLGGARVFAALHDRRLRVHWNREFACPWSMFTTAETIDLIEDVEWNEMVTACPGLEVWKYGHEAWTHELGASEVPDLALSACWVPQALGILPDAAVDAVRSTVAQSAAETIADRVALPPGSVGVHVRRTDFQPAILHSPLELFISTLKEFPRGTSFLVCSDDVAEVESLKQQGFNVMLSGLAVGRSSAVTLLNDLAEMLLLSRCSTILGSYGSSFSRFASLYGSVPLRVVSKRSVSVEDCPWW